MKNKNFQNAFSLMEMMVVLLIVAIIAAATAPMVTKKMTRNVGSGDSPWVFTGLNNNIAYNMSGADASAIIGASSYSHGDNQPSHPRLVLAANGADHPALVFAKADGAYGGQINMDPDHQIVTMNDQTVGRYSVAFGFGQTIDGGEHVVAIGDGVKVNNNPQGAVAIGENAISNGEQYTVAIGVKATAAGNNSIAIGGMTESEYTSAAKNGIALGTGTKASGDSSIALGLQAKANKLKSIAIGSNAEAQAERSIALGSLGNDSTTKTIAANIGGIAIGSPSVASGQQSVAIGSGATVSADYSVAIGTNAKATTNYQIVLGTPNDTVYIPGRLVVDSEVVVGRLGAAFIFNKAIMNNSSSSVRSWNGGLTILGKKNDSYEARTSSNNNPSAESIYLGGSKKNFSSDRRLKNVGEKYTAGLEELKKLDFYHYTFKADKDNTPLVGVMAQDLQKVFPDAVTKGEDGYLRIRLEDMFYAVINAVKELDTKVSQIVADVTGISSKVDEQQKVIEAQQQKIDELEKANADFEKRLAKLEKKNKKIEE